MPTPSTPHRWAHPRASRAVVLAALLVLASLGAAVLPTPRPVAAASAVTTSDLNLREGPSTDYAVILVMPAGAEVNIVEDQQNGFYRVRYQGVSGWASAEFLEQGGGGGGNATVATDFLNLRAGPSSDDAVLAVMPWGTAITLTGDSANGYLSVSFDGIDGWAFADYIDDGSGSVPSGDGGTATVATDALNLRSGPGADFDVLAVMFTGAEVTLTGDSSNGFLGATYNGVSGWAFADYLDTGGGTSNGGTDAVTTSDLNLRAGPSIGDDVLAVMPSGAALVVTGDPQGGFYPVTYGGQSGWASADYISFDSDPGSNPGVSSSTIVFPFAGGSWEVIQGYNGGTHQNRSAFAQYYYSMDWARSDGNTAGQPIYSPVNGTVLWQDPGSGGILIDVGNGYTIAMFHVTWEGWLTGGVAVSQGDYLGTISGPGGPGYQSTPHVDMTLWLGGGMDHVAAPFSGANAISGWDFPDTGGYNQYMGTTVSP